MDIEIALASTVKQIGIRFRSLHEHFHRFIQKLLAEFQTVMPGFLVEQLNSLIDDRAMNEIFPPPRRGGSGARREAEGVGVDEADAVHDVEGLAELVVRFAGEA